MAKAKGPEPVEPVDLTEVSLDAANSSYAEVRPDDIDDDAGRQVEQTLGKPGGGSAEAAESKKSAKGSG